MKKRDPYQRGRQLVRCLRLMQILETAHCINLDWLAKELRVTTRTIRRDLIALATAGLKVPRVGNQKDMAA